ncbi:Grx4 family monothiol glutaredoxin [Candidatus Uabimicrobium amorphum]|uniref:Glutaredoxin n=1 Tax=Uabimicrobium amorphum TaxID=2596890 RepID=A0A5S9IJM1_UABAM|nr:glutaredoxin [Candidatus Uabimicrobium amorphum]
MSRDVQQEIKETVESNEVVLYMKGTAMQPMCGFSAQAVAILKACGVTNFKDINVLDDDLVRQGIKDFSDWKTIPQLYIKGEFVGGCDIMGEMYKSNELQDMLGSA